MPHIKHRIWKTINQLITPLGLFIALGQPAFAASPPGGVELADKQEIAIHTTAEASTLDPQKMEGTAESLLARQLFEGLVNTDEAGQIVPGVAERWEYLENAQKVRFYLRSNAKWSNGDPVTAHDFVYAWQRLVDPKTASPYASYLLFMKMANVQAILDGKQAPDTLGVKALDDHTLELTLTAPVPYAVDLTQHTSLYPVHRATVEKYGEEWTRPQNLVGNGAYQLGERVLNEKITLTRNPNYWDNDKTVIEKSTFYVLTETAAIARYRTGTLDISYIPGSLYRDAQFQRIYGSQIYRSRKLGTFTYEMNLAQPPFNDIRVRKALTLAVERDIITHKVLNFGQTPAFTFTPPYIKGGERIQLPVYAHWTQAERNEAAKQLLAEAGYSKANPLKTELLYNTNEGLKEIAIAVTSIWKKNLDGMVDIQLKNMEWKTFLDTKNQKNYALAFSAWVADYNDASTFLTYYLSNSAQNHIGFHSPRFDQLLHDAHYAKNDTERAEIYAKAEAELDSHYPFVPIYHYAGQIIKNPKLKGYEGQSAKEIYFLKDLYLEK